MCNCHKWTKSQLLVHHPTLTSRMKSCFFLVAILVIINPIPLILRKPQMVPNICKSLTEPWFIARKKKFFLTEEQLRQQMAQLQQLQQLQRPDISWGENYQDLPSFVGIYQSVQSFLKDLPRFTITCRRIRYNLRFFLATLRTWWSIKLGIFDFLDEPILTRMAKAMVGVGVHLGH